MAELSFPDFRGRVVALERRSDEDLPFTMLEEARFELQGGRVFVIGRVPVGVNEDDWCAGAVCAVAWDEVAAYYLFDSVADYLEKTGAA